MRKKIGVLLIYLMLMTSFLVVFPINNIKADNYQVNVYTDKLTYNIDETIAYGIKNTLNIPIGIGFLYAQRSVNGIWENIDSTIVYLRDGVLNPGEKWERTWNIPAQTQNGDYRIAGIYYIRSTSFVGYSYFNIGGSDGSAKVYTNKLTYNIDETITYGIENILNKQISIGCLYKQRYVNGIWENIDNGNCLINDFLNPGEKWELTWNIPIQTQPGEYRIAGTYYISSTSCTEYAYFNILSALGDMNGDGLLNSGDVRWLTIYIISKGTNPNYRPLYSDGDVNCDGFLNLGDVRYLAIYCATNGMDPNYSPLYPCL